MLLLNEIKYICLWID